MVLDPNFAVTSCNEVQASAILSLLDDVIFWQVEQRCDVVYQEFNDVNISLKYIILFNGIIENVLCYLNSKTRWNHLKKLVQFLLVVQIVLRRHHEFSHSCLQCLRKLHVFHWCVWCVYLFLDSLGLNVEWLDDDCNCTKDVRVGESADDEK